MSVITVRTELINWYKRHGYAETGDRKPFIEDGITGNHKQTLEFLYLETGATPVKWILAQRRINFLKHILDKEKNELLYKVFQAQKLLAFNQFKKLCCVNLAFH